MLEAAAVEEKNHHLLTAADYYDAVIDLIIEPISNNPEYVSKHIRRMFIHAVEHRAALFPFHPTVKKNHETSLYCIGICQEPWQLAIRGLFGASHWSEPLVSFSI